MRKIVYSVFKSYMHKTLQQRRQLMGISQEEMAHLLCMSSRAYASIESRASSCGMMTFIIFVLKCCPDRVMFLTELFDTLDRELSAEKIA